jgi:hypothetical protein
MELSKIPVDDTTKLLEAIQGGLSEIEQTIVLKSIYREEAKMAYVFRFGTVFDGDEYGFELGLPDERIQLDGDVYDEVQRQIASSCRSVERAILKSAGAPTNPDEKRDEPFFISETCPSPDCVNEPLVRCQYNDKDPFYDLWECESCGTRYVDSQSEWNEWV